MLLMEKLKYEIEASTQLRGVSARGGTRAWVQYLAEVWTPIMRPGPEYLDWSARYEWRWRWGWLSLEDYIARRRSGAQSESDGEETY